MDQQPKVFIVIINWNQHLDTIECVGSAKDTDYDNFEIVVVDNASEAGSVDFIRGSFPGVAIIENDENLGYAGGSNVGIRYALDKGADYVLVLNSDVVLDKDFLLEMIKAARENGESGILAPKVCYYDRRSVINSLGTTINWFRLRPHLGECGQEDHGQFREIERKDILVGCALLIKRSVFEEIGFFDEKLFSFHEDADLCLRNIRHGGKNLTVPGAKIYHKTAGSVKECRPLVNYYTIRNFLYLAKNNASVMDRIKVCAGLQFLVVKNAISLLFGAGEKKAFSRAFFCGIADYFSGKMGRSKRAF